MSAFNTIRQIIEGRMASWDGAPVEYEGWPTPPPVEAAQQAKTPWCRLTIRDGDSFTSEVGAGPIATNPGSIFVQIFIEADTGTIAARNIADSITDHLQYYSSGHMETLAASYIPVGEENGYYQANVRIPFRYH